MLLHKLLHISRLCIHLAFHIADCFKLPVPEHTLIMNETAVIPLTEETAHGLNTGSCVRLISAGPEENRRMVLIPLQHGSCPVHHTGLPFRPVSRHIPGRLAPSHLLPGAMAFQIRLIHQIDTVLIAQLIPPRLIRIMAGPHRIDIMLLHKPNIPQHVFFGNGSSPVRIEFMAIDSVKHQTSAVQTHDAVLHLKPSKSHRLPYCLCSPAILQHSNLQLIQIRLLCTPRLHRLQKLLLKL